MRHANWRHLVPMALCLLLPLAARAETPPPVLAGAVRSDREGAMEGVVVTATRPGSIVAVSVTSDAAGRYVFPAGRLDPGDYTLAIRAAGYRLAGPAGTRIAAGASATADLTLLPVADLSSQLSNAEWMISLPGSEAQKAPLLDCTSCHTLERVMRSTHDAAEWAQVIVRMNGYAQVSHPLKPQRLPDQGRAGKPEQFRELAAYLASINLSATDQWSYALRTLPRPHGRETRAIVTEYDLRRPTIEPHDVIVDRAGKVWYSDFGGLFVGAFDPRTLALTEYPVRRFKPRAPVGLLSLAADQDGRIWFDTLYQGAIGRLDPVNGHIDYFRMPAQYDDDWVQLNFLGLHHERDGKVWTKNVGSQHVFRIDVASGAWEAFRPTDRLPMSRPGIYEVLADSRNNLWMAEFFEGYLGRIDARTTDVAWYAPPTPHARLRRLTIDGQDRVVVTEYRGNKVAVFDPRAERFTEYALPVATFPYRAETDRNGQIWTSTMSSDRLLRLDPATGTVLQYLMPTTTNMRSVFVDNSTDPVTIWVGSNHDHRLVRIEPLD